MFAERWAAFIVRRRRAVVAVWALLVVASLAATPYLMSSLGAPDYGVPGSQSAEVAGLIRAHFSGAGDEQDIVVLASAHGALTAPAARARVSAIVTATREADHVVSVVGPFDPGARGQVSADERTAFAVVGLRGTTKQLSARAKHVQSAVQDAAGGDVRAWLTGYSPITNDLTTVENRDSERAESIGIPVALIVLLLALGSVVAALLPLLLALAGLCLTFGVIAIVATTMNVDAFLTAIVTMIGMGIGIDYALFVVSRFREELTRRGIVRSGDSADRRLLDDAVSEATGRALATSGRTIAFSGVIVAISMCSLFIVNSPVFQEISVGVLAVVACTLFAAWTLLPAVLAMLGPKVNAGRLPQRFQPAEARTDADVSGGGWARWAHAVMRHPLLAGGAVALVLVLAALPLGDLRYGIDLGTSSLSGQPAAQAQAALVRSFGPGLVAPVQVAVTAADGGRLDGRGRAAASALADALSSDARVASTRVSRGDGRVLVEATPKSAIDSRDATALVQHIRADLEPAAARQGVQALVGGATAQFADVSHETSRKVPYILVIVLGLTVLLLLGVFRSAVLPIKAAAMNLLATAASVGITVAVFQWGHGSSALGFTPVGFLQVYIPISVFVMLFGLSMDYEVFLIRRMHEKWLETGDNTEAVASGIEHTARPIAAAAAIMVAVFGSFVTAGVLELKEFGLALAVAVALDATLVRLVLVPAFMKLLGSWNWWLPGRGRPELSTPAAARLDDALELIHHRQR